MPKQQPKPFVPHWESVPERPKEWSQEELRNSDENISGIKRCCRHERNVYGNYIWIYKYDKEFKKVMNDDNDRHTRKRYIYIYI